MSEIQNSSWRIDEWFPTLDAKCRERLKILNDEVIRFNRTLNLISVKTIAFADVIHFSDCILGSQAIMQANPEITEIFDIGSGNGFPGLVFAILFPRVKVKLIEGDQKRCEFLQNTVLLCGVQNAEVKNVLIEKLETDSIRFCMARGLASISKSIMMMRKQVIVGGIFFHFKSESWSVEVGEIPTQLCSVWSPALISEYKLPIGPVKFAVVKTDKIS